MGWLKDGERKWTNIMMNNDNTYLSNCEKRINRMDDTLYISICLSDGGIRLFRNTVRNLNTPPYVKFYIHKERAILAIAPDFEKTLLTHKTPKNLYDEYGKMVVYSKKFCDIIYREMNWNKSKLYRVPGQMMKKENAAFFDLSKAEMLKQG